MKKNISIAIVIMTALITGCGNNEPTEIAAPTVIENQVVETIDDTESVDDTEPVEVEEVPETPLVTGRVNRDDYWEGDTFHLDDYAAALGFNHLEDDTEFGYRYYNDDGSVASYIYVTVSNRDEHFEYHDMATEQQGRINFFHHGDDSGENAYIEYDDKIMAESDSAAINGILNIFDAATSVDSALELKELCESKQVIDWD